MDKIRIKEIIKENKARRAAQEAREREYNPETGQGCQGERVEVEVRGFGRVYIPQRMTEDKKYEMALRRGGKRFENLRIQYDFEYWAYRCVTIQDKKTGKEIAFRLNGPQRRVLSTLEGQRLAKQPIRIIILKARQWGGSTLVQIYMAWIQLVLLKNQNSYICSHLKDTSRTILSMYDRLIARYPKEFTTKKTGYKLKAVQESRNMRKIEGRDCLITIGSSESPEASRGSSLSLAHLSEVSFWKDSRLRSPEDLIRAIVSGIPLEAMTFVAMESTANGVGTFFHREWLRAEQRESVFMPVFVPWYEIVMNEVKVGNVEHFVESMNRQEEALWERYELTLEQINWYRLKCREMGSKKKVMAEYPTTAVEAFANTGYGVFPSEHVERLREGCYEAEVRGDMSDEGYKNLKAEPRFIEDAGGRMAVWKYPEEEGDYVISVDVGGRSEQSDRSVICVMRQDGERPEVVAQWVGHTDHDLLAWKAASIAKWYNKGVLIIESNTLETESYGEPSVLLSELETEYINLYRREGHPGFHTNVKTKAEMIMRMISAVRDGGYVERDHETCNELIDYEQRPNGSYGARKGRHDDRLMTRALAITVIHEGIWRRYGRVGS